MSLFVTRRRRRRMRIRRTVGVFLLVTAAVLFAWFAWDAGQYSLQAEREALARRGAELEVQLAEETQKGTELLAELEALRRSHETLEGRLARETPRGLEADLFALVRERLGEGVSPERVAAVLGSLGGAECVEGETFVRRIVVRTQHSRGGQEAAVFADGAISVTMTALDESGILPVRFDSGLPLRLVATLSNSEPVVRETVLPISFVVEHGLYEYRFLAIEVADELGRAEVRAQRCLLGALR
ncbi:MAG: hypothetical protein MPK62_07375 [Alphaproteobacteria bacterium]|nr:hypothetical protein [Alphaproteobacteria bacterium]